eukprot:365377-Chlamydomonas_euryale.AAC.50
MVRVVDADGNVVPRDLLHVSPEHAGSVAADAASAAIDGGAGRKGGAAGVSSAVEAGNQQASGACGGAASLPGVTEKAGTGLEPCHHGRPRTQLVLLDFGLAEELAPRVRHHFLSFISSICAGRGRCAAQHLLQWADVQRCPDPLAFTDDVVALFAAHANIHAARGIDLDRVMKETLRVCRKWVKHLPETFGLLVA